MLTKTHKRGISPLIATAILVGFAVIITTTVMIFGTELVQDIKEKQGAKATLALQCNSDVKMKIANVDAARQEVTIQNAGTRDITSFLFSINDGDYIKQDVPVPVQPGGQKVVSYAPPGYGDTITTLLIVPKINLAPGGIYQSCGESALTIDIA